MVAAVSLRMAPAPRRDWRWQVRNAVTNADDLARALTLTPSEIEGARRAEHAGLPMSITPYYLGLASKNDPNDPIRRQCVPDVAERETHEGDMVDPLGEVAHGIAPHLVQRYPDRVLLLVSDRCSVYCRFCTRSRIVGQAEGAVSLEALKPALDHIRAHTEVRDVIVSGGDPLVMSTEKLARIVGAVRAIPSVDTIRLATRVPVTLPMRIGRELLSALKPLHPIWVMTHFNHPREMTPQASHACEMLARGGFPVMNQTVLLRGVNNDANVLEELFRKLVAVRVRPYYLLQMDPVRGSSHMRTPLMEGVEIMRALQGRVSGIALPKFVCDTPGGKGKVVLAHDPVVARVGKRTTLRTFTGEDIDYIDP
jgi:lysine 2,3-aminomutase